MTAFSIPGLDQTAIDRTDHTAKKHSGKPFPATDRWTTFTGEVTSVETKVLGENEYLSIRVRNGECGAELLVSTEPDKTYDPKNEEDRQNQVQRNLDTLAKAVKALGIFKNGKVDPALYAGGVVVAFGAKHKGTRIGSDGKTYPKIGYIFNGVSPDGLIPVQPLAGALATPADPGADDIPF
jgi:hypothetical protein